MRKVLLVLLAIFFIIWLQCDTFVPTYENIVGTYHYEGDDQKKIDLYTFEIFPDSTFIARYRKNPDDSIQIHRGKIISQRWEIDFDVWLDMACFYCDDRRPKPRIMYSNKRFFDKNRINFSTDPDTRNHSFVRDSLMEYEGIDYFLTKYLGFGF